MFHGEDIIYLSYSGFIAKIEFVWFASEVQRTLFNFFF